MSALILCVDNTKIYAINYLKYIFVDFIQE